MSIALTATLPRAFIDLTNDEAPLPSASEALPAIIKAARDEPAAKRRRAEDASPRNKSLKACVQELILPNVVKAVERLSREDYLVDDIAVQAVARLARSPTFRIRVDEANGSSLPLQQADTADTTLDVVRKLSALPRFQIQPRTPRPQASLRTSVAATGATKPTASPPQPNVKLGAASSPGSRAHYTPKRSNTRTTKAEAVNASKWFRLKKRPYLPAAERSLVAKGVRHAISGRHDAIKWPVVYHVDFTSDEVAQIFLHMSKYLPTDVPQTLDCLAALCYQYNVASMVGNAIHGRSTEDLRHFCSDLMAGQAASDKLRVLSLERDVHNQRREQRRASRIPSLLLARELDGNARFGRTRRFENFQNEFKKAHEDGLALVAEFTNCAGDISTMAWVPDGNVLCGTTAHSDAHNQQYNKPGNLVLCSTSQGTLRAFADHRIPRPLVEKGENSTEAMRQSQDPWLYSSVVSSDYDQAHGRAFTSSFDKTVKVWTVANNGESMKSIATWHHGGNVNFVAAAKDGSGRVASAADVPSAAIRIYTVNADNVAESPYQAVSCSRTDADDSGAWAYFPATMQWGREPQTTRLLVVGYSPRSLTADDHKIPEDKRNSGEILLWDASRGCRVPVLTATTANVFEVAWHPRLPRFIVATSPCGLNIEHGVRTQIHLFQLDRGREDGAYSEFQKLDCFAEDINELTFMPNSLRHAYITAGCTDGKVYVWDTAQGDHPIHVLEHDDPLDDFSYDREKEDTGVKFTAWGTTPDRLYTGSSDGVVKVWNVRNGGKAFVRNLLEAPGPISCGAFSSDHSKLAIGDATGRVFLFSVDERDEHEEHFTTLPGSSRRIRRPKPFIPHPEPPPLKLDPAGKEVDAAGYCEAEYAHKTYIASGQLVLNRNPVVGVVRGPMYAETGLFRREAHLDEDPTGPLLTEYERNQRESLHTSRGLRRRSQRRLKNPYIGEMAAQAAVQEREMQHAANRNLDMEGLEWDCEGLWNLLVRDGAVLTDIEEDWGFIYEDMPL